MCKWIHVENFQTRHRNVNNGYFKDSPYFHLQTLLCLLKVSINFFTIKEKKVIFTLSFLKTCSHSSKIIKHGYLCQVVCKEFIVRSYTGCDN